MATGLAGCGGKPTAGPASTEMQTVELTSPEEGGAVSTAPVEPAVAVPAAVAADPAHHEVDWSPRALESGEASLGCELDYASQGDGAPLVDLDHDSIVALLAPCIERGVMRLRYVGKVQPDFTALVERVTTVADELGIDKRVLDINSSGGMVEDAIRAGDFIAESRWTVWVREDAVCHSACVFVLAAGDVRMIGGKVGIHRIIRMSSTASTRRELNRELRVVYDHVRDYLERNGAAVAVADLMMAVPNRSLRLLTTAELKQYGLDGINPAQDDLDRLRLMRKCGQDFVSRRDAFVRAFDARCRVESAGVEELNACGLSLRGEFGFPDEICPDDSPLSEFDHMADAPVQEENESPPAHGQAGQPDTESSPDASAGSGR